MEIQTSYHLLINNNSGTNKSNKTTTKINTRPLTLNTTTLEHLNLPRTYKTKSLGRETWDTKVNMDNNNNSCSSSKCLQVVIQGNNSSSRISRSQHLNNSTIIKSKTREHSLAASLWMTIILHSRDLLLLNNNNTNSEWINSSNKVMRKNKRWISSMLNNMIGLEAVGNINSNNNNNNNSTTNNNRCSTKRDKSWWGKMSSPRNWVNIQVTKAITLAWMTLVSWVLPKQHREMAHQIRDLVE